MSIDSRFSRCGWALCIVLGFANSLFGQTLPPPTLVSPGTSSAPGQALSTTTPTFQWQPVTGANGYALYISQFNGSTYTLIFDSSAIGGPLGGTSYLLPGGQLQNGSQYRWNMATHNSGGYGSPNTSRLYVYVSLPAPTVQTFAPTFITGTSAQMNGSVNPNGQSTSATFQYGTTTSYGSAATPILYGSGITTAQGIQASLTGLTPSTTYHYRTMAWSSGGTNYGNDASFQTTGQAIPTVQTLAASAVTASSAQLNGSVNPNGASTSAYFEYGISTSYGAATVASGVGSGTTALNFQTTISGLGSPGTVFHYRIVAYNSGGTNYGNDVTFQTTAQSAPTVQTFSPSYVTANSAQLNGYINPNGSSATAYFQYGTTISYGSMTTPGIFSTPQYIGFPIDGLPSGTEYHYRLVAPNGGAPVYGYDASFTTASGQASLSVTPSILVFPTIHVGQTADRTFTVSNIGNATFSGTATVGAPFNVVSGGAYTLPRGQSQKVTVRYAPTAVENDEAYVTFTGGGGQTRQVSGSAFSDPTPTSGSIAGIVTRADNHTPVDGVGITVLIPGGNLFNGPSTLSGPIGGQAGSYVISGLAPGTQYSVIATPADQSLYLAELDGVSVVGGQVTTRNIALTPVPTQNQPPSATPANTPVVLVRGFGPDKDWGSGESGYWASTRSALQEGGFPNVWDCNQPEVNIFSDEGHVINGEMGIDDNAIQLRLYLEQKSIQYERTHGYYPPQIDVVAHSMGGLITREVVGSDDRLSFYDSALNQGFTVKFGKVIMLATPQCGTIVADASLGTIPLDGIRDIGPELGDLLKNTWGSTHDLSRSFVRNTFNSKYRNWPSSVYLYLFSASGPNAYSDRDLIAGYTFINAYNALLPPDETGNDGCVTIASAAGVYWQWGANFPFLRSYTSVNLNAIQSVTDWLIAGQALDHRSLLTNVYVANWVVNTLANPNPTATNFQTPKIAAAASAGGTPLRTMASTSSLLPMQEIESVGGILLPGTSVVARIVSDASSTLKFQVFGNDTNIVFHLTDPSGTTIDTNSPLSNPNVQYSTSVSTGNLLVASYQISEATNGVWYTILDGSSVTSTQAAYSLMVFGDSSVGLLPQTGTFFNQGQDAVVSCLLADLSTNPFVSVQNASVTAGVYLPDGSTNNLTLFDDGWHNDGAPNDAVYATVLANVRQAGDYSVFYRASGTNNQGQALQRVASSTFSVSSGDANILGDPIYETIDTNGDGAADFLTIKCWVNPKVAGTYIISGDLVDSTETLRFSQSAQFTSDGSGPMQVTLIFDLAQIRAAGGQGALHVENLQLFEVTGAGTAWLDTYRGSSIAYIASGDPLFIAWLASFNLPTDGSADYADSDGDGMNNMQEYLAGTDPTNPNSVLKITAIQCVGADVQVFFTSVNGKYYSLARCDSMGGTWTSIVTNIPGTGGVRWVKDVGGATRGDAFYRIQLSQLTNAPAADSVGDGIADVWRAQYFPSVDPIGATTNNLSCATCDADGTGQNNLFKYVTGLDPTNPVSVFVLNIERTPNQPHWQTLVFNPVVGGRTYTPQFSTDLVSGVWMPLTTYTSPVTNCNQITVTDTNPIPPQEFYRLDISSSNGASVQTLGCGSLELTIVPAAAVTAGAQWQVDGGAWQSSGWEISGLKVGQHTVHFNTVSGWTQPGDQSVSIQDNQTATITGTYVPNYTVLYSFVGSPNDGANPLVGFVQGSDGSFYGTTVAGGSANCVFGCGTVFRISPNGTYTNLYFFGGHPGGAYPSAGLVQGWDGNFYGTTEMGGMNGCNCGIVFRISPVGSLTNLYSFAGYPTDGSGPLAVLVQGSDGNFYGTSNQGGTSTNCYGGCGTVFRISPNGTYTNLYSFGSSPSDGNYPRAGLVLGSDGNFYGTTASPGAINGRGTVFRISSSGSLTNLHVFSGSPNDGGTPNAGLVQGGDSNFYGTTYDGGANYEGAVFRIGSSGTYTNLYSFAGSPNDGAEPEAGLVQGSDGNFYGTTYSGGTNGNGIVFRISPSGAYTNLHSFSGAPNDGAEPEGVLVQGSDGSFYGTTYSGGSNGNGIVFRLSVPLGSPP